MQKLLIAGLFSLAFLTPAVAEDVKATGCVAKGVEAGCLVLRTITFQTYDISAAKPRPRPGSYIEVVGQIKFGPSHCMQGPIIDPIKWTRKGKFCPKEGAAK